MFSETVMEQNAGKLFFTLLSPSIHLCYIKYIFPFLVPHLNLTKSLSKSKPCL